MSHRVMDEQLNGVRVEHKAPCAKRAAKRSGRSGQIRQRRAETPTADAAGINQPSQPSQPSSAHVSVEPSDRRKEQLLPSQAAFEQESSRCQDFFETAPDGYLITDAAGVIQHVNSAASVMLRATREQLIGRTLEAHVADESRGEYQHRLAQLAGEPTRIRWELTFRSHDGRNLPVEASVGTACLPDSSALCLRWLLRDFSDRKRFNEQIKALARQQAVVAKLGLRTMSGIDLPTLLNETVLLVAGVLRADHCGVFELRDEDQSLLLRAGIGWKPGYVGRAGFAMNRRTQMGHTLQSNEPVVVEDQREPARFQVPSLLSDHKVVSGATVVIRSSQHCFGVLAAHAQRPMTFTRDDIHFLQAIAHGIGAAYERRNAELLQAQLLDLLVRKNNELEQFVHTISHDLKSPLVTVQGFLEHMRRNLEVQDINRLPIFMDRIENAALRMRRHIDDLLELSRVGRVINEPEAIDVDSLIRELLEHHTREINEKHATIYIQPQLPVLHADRARVAEVFDNLLSNALKHGMNDLDPVIEFGAVEQGGEVHFFVRDHGRGIPESCHERIFRIFERLDRNTEGTGVGLAIVKRIIESHGGRVWVESTVGVGATFWMAFPAVSDSRTRRQSSTQFPRLRVIADPDANSIPVDTG